MQLVTHVILLLDATENTFYEPSSCNVLTPAPVDGDIFFERRCLGQVLLISARFIRLDGCVRCSIFVSLPRSLSLLLWETEHRVLVQEKEKHMQTAPPLRARQSIMGKRVQGGNPVRLKFVKRGRLQLFLLRCLLVIVTVK